MGLGSLRERIADGLPYRWMIPGGPFLATLAAFVAEVSMVWEAAERPMAQ
jgi:hypothetical protein